MRRQLQYGKRWDEQKEETRVEQRYIQQSSPYYVTVICHDQFIFPLEHTTPTNRDLS